MWAASFAAALPTASTLSPDTQLCTGQPTFVHIPKDAGCTILHLVQNNCTGVLQTGAQDGSDPHVPAHGCDGEFAVLREPLHRFESWIKYNLAAHFPGLPFSAPAGNTSKLDDIFDAIEAGSGLESLRDSNFFLQGHWLQSNTRLVCHPQEVPALVNGMDMGAHCPDQGAPVDHANEHGSDTDDHLSSTRAERIRAVYADDVALWDRTCKGTSVWYAKGSLYGDEDCDSCE